MAAPTTAPPQQGGDQESRSPYASKWFIASAVVVGLVLALALYLIVVGPYEAPQQHAEGQAPGGGPQATTSVCGLPDGDQAPPVTAPRDTRWQLVGTMAAPVEDGVGPADQRGGVNTCYAPTPVGALYAAVNYVAATTAVELREPAARTLCAPGPGRDAALADIARDPGTRSTGVQLVGFLYSGYVPATSATIDLAVTTGKGEIAHFPISLVWTDGDWKVQLPVTGAPYAAAQILPTLGAPWVTWSGA